MLTVSYIDIENSIMLMSYFVWYLTKVEKAKQRIVIPGTNLFWVYYLDTFHEFSQFICRCGLNMETFQVSKILWGGQKNISQKSWCLVKMLWRQMLFFFFFLVKAWYYLLTLNIRYAALARSSSPDLMQVVHSLFHTYTFDFFFCLLVEFILLRFHLIDFRPFLHIIRIILNSKIALQSAWDPCCLMSFEKV